MLTNTGLVRHCKKALSEEWGYVWGTFGTVLTEKLIIDKLKQYPNNIKKYESFIRSNWMGKIVVDCVGLIKSYLWWDGTKAVYNSATDVSANTMYERAKEKGKIDTLPEIPGLCLWFDGHIGVYIGQGWAIESRGTKYGVVKTKLEERPWTHWLKCPYIDYEIEPFADISGHWAKDLIIQAHKEGIIEGYPDGTFRPDAPITRAESVALVMAAMKKAPG